MMKNYKALIADSMAECEAVNIPISKNITWSINSRAKTRWGLCKKTLDGRYEIQIAKRLLEDDAISEFDCKNTIIHELLHTCYGCMKHTGRWKKYADLMNATYGYNIKRVTSGEEKGVENHISKSQPVKYIISCKNCGFKTGRKKMCNVVKYPKRYICPNCNGRKTLVCIQASELK